MCSPAAGAHPSQLLSVVFKVLLKVLILGFGSALGSRLPAKPALLSQQLRSAAV